MPVFFEAEQRFPIVLECDKDKPSNTRPTFYFPSVTMRKYTALSLDVDAAMEHSTVAEIFAANCTLLSMHCVGWKHMGGFEFGKSDPQDFLTHQEVRELLGKFLRNQHVTIEEKKSSE